MTNENHGCSIEDCTRHALWGGFCRDHLINPDAPVQKKKTRKKKIDAVEVLTTDADANEERTDINE